MRNRLSIFRSVFGNTLLWSIFAATLGGALYGGVLYPIREATFTDLPFMSLVFVLPGLVFGSILGTLFGIAGGIVNGVWLGSLTATIIITPHQSILKQLTFCTASLITMALVTGIGVHFFIIPIITFDLLGTDFGFYYGLPLLIAGVGGWWVANRVIAAGQVKGKRKKNDGTLVEPIVAQAPSQIIR